MQTNAQEALKTLNLKKVWLPILCGMTITGWLFYKSDKVSSETIALLSQPHWGYLGMAFLCIVLRECGHICRLRIISNAALTWKSCFYIAILWEFASAVTPSAVGGGIIAIFLFSKEGFSMGKSIAYVIVHGVMDNLFFLLSGSFGFGGAYDAFFAMTGSLPCSVKTIFFLNYTVLFVYTFIIAMGIFINPSVLQWILMQATSFRFLRRWRQAAYQLSKDIVVTSNEFRGKPFFFWCKVLVCTFATWMIRYAFLNCLIAAYSTVSLGEHLAIFGKQIIMWALMLVPVSPGGSGLAECLFQQFFSIMLGDCTLLIALLWRLCTFYLYLTLGAIFLPKWIKRVFGKCA